MNSDGKREDNVDPNLDRPSKSRPCSKDDIRQLTTLHHSENLHEHVLAENCYMPPSEVNNLPALTKSGTFSQEPCLVDGASCSKLNLSRSSSVSNRPHQVDAVHPFFNGYKSVKFDKSTSTDNQVFYCRQCEINIELYQEAVNQHFLTKQHTPIEEHCVYCNTAVYEYFYNENVCYYHKCPTESKKSHKSPKENSSAMLSSTQSPDEQESVKSDTNKSTKSYFCKPL